MDKADFINIAPAYYELAVLVEVWTRGGYLSESTLRDAYTPSDDDGAPGFTLLPSDVLLEKAIKALIKHDVIEAIDDHFGPTLYKRSHGINDYIERLEADSASAFHKSSRAPDRKSWIFNALVNLNAAYDRLNVRDEDFEKAELEWAPIPLDRADANLGNAIEAVDETIEQVEQNNGYAAEHPEERKFVLDNLRMLSDTLKNAATTSVAYVKNHGLNVLSKLQTRFGDALVGEVAKEAGKALWTWLREVVKAAL
jgi:hypothetical protein